MRRIPAASCQTASPGAAPKDVPLVSLPSDNPIQVVIEKQLSRLGLAHQERPRMNLIGTLIGMVRAGRGSAIVPSFALEECLRRPGRRCAARARGAPRPVPPTAGARSKTGGDGVCRGVAGGGGAVAGLRAACLWMMLGRCGAAIQCGNSAAGARKTCRSSY